MKGRRIRGREREHPPGVTGIERAEEDVRRVDSEAHQEVAAKRLRLGEPAAILGREALVQPGTAGGLEPRAGTRPLSESASLIIKARTPSAGRRQRRSKRKLR